MAANFSHFSGTVSSAGVGSDTRVSSLIDQHLGSWNFQLIQALFPHEEAEHICDLPISLLHQSDKLIWRGTKNGIFTVRSAYHLKVQRKGQEMGEFSRQVEITEFWKWLWNTNAPVVLKSFDWRLSRDLFPTKNNLFRRQVVSNPLCPVCSAETETTFHILWSFPSSIAVWQEGSRRVQKLSIMASDRMGLL
jgi:hypothetical protein